MEHSAPAPLRVLWLTKGLGPGGAERLLVTHAALSDSAAFAYEAAYLLPGKDHLVSDLEALGVRTHCLDGSREADVRWAGRLRRLLRRGRFDVLHSHSPYPATLARLVSRSLPRSTRPALVYTEHNRWPSHNRLTRTANRLTYGFDDAHLAVSDDVRDSTSRRWRDHVEVVVHGVDVDAVRRVGSDRAAARAELGVTEGDVLVGTVAHLRATKGYPDLVEAARIVTSADPATRFVAVGHGPMTDEVAQRARELGLGDRFRLLGYRGDALRVIAALDVFVLASHHEGRPVALMEAMALGRPCVTTAVGDMPVLLDQGTAGVLVAPGAPGELAAAILALTGDEARRAELGGAAARRADAYGGRAAVAEIERVYRRVAGGRR